MADTCGQVLLGTGLTVLSHPLMYIKVLVQVGHEPLPPTLGRNIFGRQVYQLPGLFAYAKYITKIDGKAGLFKGLAPRLCAGSIGTIVHSRVLQVGMCCKFFCVLLCMVQFIGRETKYSGVFSSIGTIYKEEGILGFFAGLIPRLLGDILSLWICNMLAHLINTYAIDDTMNHMGEIKNCSLAVTGFFASMLTYPFVLVSNLMAVNNCGLAGGLPPYASVYPTWVDCWRHLSREGNMSRGNSLFFRKLPAGKTYAVDQQRFF
uniref:Mitochondrial carrier homolog 2 n=1 Tax=Scleropages formosus TaxID=113540 RepID=A0A8C9VMJ9_SCLFO